MNLPDRHPERVMQFEFKGTAFQYFGIWIVNLLLTIITLGIYSAWAKVRTKRFFYGNTLLDGSPFDYLASPVSILKGWGIAVVVLLVYKVMTNVLPVTSLLLVPLMLMALPWVIVRAMRFRARNSAWRNIRFSFRQAYTDAFKVFVGVQVLMVLTLGLLLPYYYYAISRFMVTNSGYGTTPFSFHAAPKDFYKIFMKPALAMLVMLIALLAISYPKLKEYYDQYQADVESAQTIQNDDVQYADDEVMDDESVIEYQDTPMIDDGAPLNTDQSYEDQRDLMLEQAMQDLADAEASLVRTTDNDIQPLDLSVEENEQAQSFEEILANMALPDEQIKEEADASAESQDQAPGNEQPDTVPDNSNTGVSEAVKHAIIGMGMLFMLAIFLFYLVFMAYIQSRIWNLVYNSTKLNEHYFKSSIRARDILWLYASNMIVISFTFGLMIPWAKVRMARYRASKMQFIAIGDLDHFMQAQQEKISALGEELGDVFDLDIGI